MTQILHEAFLVGVDDIGCTDVIDAIVLTDRFTVVEVWIMAVVDIASIA